MLVVLEYILIVIGAYFIGNISWARIISKINHSDVTKSGSGNPGTMNMLRTYGAKLGALTLVLDTVKGLVPALVGYLLLGTVGLYAAGLAVVVGHIYPICYKFKGGKGIACTLGVFLVANPLWLLICFVVAFVYIWLFDYGSIASLTIIAAMVAIEGLKNQGNLPVCLLLFAIFLITWFAHRSNIVRLLLGKENKANLKNSFKHKVSKEQKEIVKDEYKQGKSELRKEYKELRAEYKKTVKEKKKALKKEFKEIRHKQNSDILAEVISKDITVETNKEDALPQNEDNKAKQY